MRLKNTRLFQMGFTYLRIYKSKSERIQRDKITQKKLKKKGETLKYQGNCKYVNTKSMGMLTLFNPVKLCI